MPRLQIIVAYPKIVIAHTRHDEYQYKGVKIIDIADQFFQLKATLTLQG